MVATVVQKAVEAKNINRYLQEIEAEKAMEYNRSGITTKKNSSDGNNRSHSFHRRGGKEVLAIDCSGRGCSSEKFQAVTSGTSD